MQVDDAIEKAFEVWTNVTNLRIVRKKEYEKEKADINIRFAVGKHDRTEFDKNSFDGLGGVVGHAFFPPDGRLHFDDDEIWKIDLNLNSKGDFYGRLVLCLLMVNCENFTPLTIVCNKIFLTKLN